MNPMTKILTKMKMIHTALTTKKTMILETTMAIVRSMMMGAILVYIYREEAAGRY
jgi:uncharacterized membrane protein YjjB (DUF3815 family)